MPSFQNTHTHTHTHTHTCIEPNFDLFHGTADALHRPNRLISTPTLINSITLFVIPTRMPIDVSLYAPPLLLPPDTFISYTAAAATVHPSVSFFFTPPLLLYPHHSPYIYIYISKHTHMCVYRLVHTHTHTHTQTHIHSHTHIHTYMCVCVYMWVGISMYKCVYICGRAYIYKYVCVCVCVCVCALPM